MSPNRLVIEKIRLSQHRKTGMTEALKLIRRKKVEELTGLKRAALYDRLNRNSPRYDPSFPKQVSLSVAGTRAGAVGFVEGEVLAWINDRITASRIKNA